MKTRSQSKILFLITTVLSLTVASAGAEESIQCKSGEAEAKIQLGSRVTRKKISLSELVFTPTGGKAETLQARLMSCDYFTESCMFRVYRKLDSAGEPSGLSVKFGELSFETAKNQAILYEYNGDKTLTLDCGQGLDAKIKSYGKRLFTSSVPQGSEGKKQR